MAKTKKYFVIVNPAANRGKAASLIPKLESLFAAKGIEYCMTVTKAPLHAKQLAQQAAKENYPIVIAAGGDGTVNEIVNGLVGTQTTLGVIPMGSGNDFSKNLALRKTDWEFDLDVLLGEKVRLIDLGMMNGRYFVNQVSLGFTGRINIISKKSPPFLKGYSMYLYAIFRLLIDYYPHHFRIRAKDEKDKIINYDECFTICDVANSRYQGGGFLVTPDAKNDDGLLDVCLVEPVSRAYILRLLPLVMQGKHVGKPHVKMLRIKEITIESKDFIPLHFDGEPGNEYKRVEIKIIPKALRVISLD